MLRFLTVCVFAQKTTILGVLCSVEAILISYSNHYVFMIILLLIHVTPATRVNKQGA